MFIFFTLRNAGSRVSARSDVQYLRILMCNSCVTGSAIVADKERQVENNIIKIQSRVSF